MASIERFAVWVRRGLAGLVVLAGAALPTSAEAQTLTDEQIENLQTLYQLGREACERKDYESCHRLFLEMEEILPWPPHQFYIAEALVGLGRMREGLQLWQRLLDDNPTPQDPMVVEFKKTAERRLAEVRPQLPEIHFELATPHRQGLVVTLDERSLEAAELSTPIQLDPGKHQLVLRQPGFTSERHVVQLEAGEHQTVSVRLEPTDERQPAPEPESVGRDTSRPPVAESSSWQRPTGIVLVGVGSAALVGAGVTYVLKEDSKERLLADCGNADPCDGLSGEAFARRQNGVESRTDVSNALAIGGGVFALTGAILWVLAEPDSIQDSAPVSMGIGPSQGWITYQGRF